MYKKIIPIFLILIAGSLLYWFFFIDRVLVEKRMFKYHFCEYANECYRQRYKPYIREVYTRFLKQESEYAESKGFPVKFKLEELGTFGSSGLGGFYVSVEYHATRYSSFLGSFHEYISSLSRVSDFFEAELRLLHSLGVYPFIVPIDPTEEPSLSLLPDSRRSTIPTK